MSRPSTLLTVKRRGGLIKGGTSRRSGCVYAPTSRRSLVQHANARLTVHARRLLVERVEAGWPQARVAEQLGVARQTVSKWWQRYQAGGDAALLDRPSTPGRCPGRTPATVERRVIAARRRHRVGPIALATMLGVPASTIGRILRRHGLRLSSNAEHTAVQ